MARAQCLLNEATVGLFKAIAGGTVRWFQLLRSHHYPGHAEGLLDCTEANLIPNRASYLRKGDSKLKQLSSFKPHLVIEIFIKLLIQHKTVAGIF